MASYDSVKGFRDSLPLAAGVATYGLVYGLAAREAGFTPGEAVAMSLAVYAGAAQFAAVGMWATAPGLSIVLTTLIINLRHLLMGASIAPYLARVGPGWKALLALGMSDESYGLAIAGYSSGRGSHLYFLGVNLGIYLSWAASSLAGAALGTALRDPTALGLGLVFPLAFLGLAVPRLRNSASLLVFVGSGLLSILGGELLPGKWYIILAGLGASLSGAILEGLWTSRSS